MDLLSLCLVFLILIFILISGCNVRKRRNLPPGPIPIPLIGSLHLLFDDDPHKSLAKQAEIHGPFMFLKLGFIDTVVISSPAMAKEVLQKYDAAFSGRAPRDAVNIFDYPDNSAVWLQPTSKWRNLRKFLNTNMFSSTSLEMKSKNIRVEKVKELILYCKKFGERNEIVDVGFAAFMTQMNLISNTIISKDSIDPRADYLGMELRDLVWNLMMEVGKPNLVDFFPFLRKLDPQGIRSRASKHIQIIYRLVQDWIDERMKMTQKIGDLMDLLLDTNIHIKPFCLDLIMAGTHTTSSTLEWAMAEALRNPNIILKVKQEMEQKIGKGNILHEDDIQFLPYLNCMIKETLRLHPPGVLIPRYVDQEIEVCGYIIPRNTQVIINVWAIGRDPKVWNDPTEFKPERFVDSKIDIYGQDFELIPFSAGRRICPGMPLANKMLPIMLGSLLNCFDWKLEDGIKPEYLDMKESFGLTIQKARHLRAIPIAL